MKKTVFTLFLSLCMTQVYAEKAAIKLKFRNFSNLKGCVTYTGNLQGGQKFVLDADSYLILMVKNMGRTPIKHASHLHGVGSQLKGIEQDGTDYKGINTTNAYFPDKKGQYSLTLSSTSSQPSKVRFCLWEY